MGPLPGDLVADFGVALGCAQRDHVDRHPLLVQCHLPVDDEVDERVGVDPVDGGVQVHNLAVLRPAATSKVASA